MMERLEMGDSERQRTILKGIHSLCLGIFAIRRIDLLPGNSRDLKVSFPH